MQDGRNNNMTDEMKESMRKNFLAGLISRNEYRAATGLPLLSPEEGDVFYVPEGQQRVHKDDLDKLLLLREIEPEVIERIVAKLKNASNSEQADE